MNIGADDGLIPAKVFDRVRAIVTGWIGEAGRRREPVGTTDPNADGERHRLVAAGADTPMDHQEQSNGRDHLGEPESAGGSGMRGCLDGGQREHEVGDHRADATADRLGERVEPGVTCADGAEEPVDQRHDWVEVRAGHSTEHEDQPNQRSRGRCRVLQQLEPDVAG